MRTGRLVALVVGCLLLLPGLAMAVGGAALAGGYAAARDDRGYVNTSLHRLRSSSTAITAEGADFGSDERGPDLTGHWSRTVPAPVAERTQKSWSPGGAMTRSPPRCR